MAEEYDSRRSSVNEVGSSSKDVQEKRDEGWLQLGLGGYMTNTTAQLGIDQAHETIVQPSGSLQLQLQLLPSRSVQHAKPLAPTFHVAEDLRALQPDSSSTVNISTPLFLQIPRTSLNFPQQEVTWGYNPTSWNPTIPSSTSYSTMSLTQYYPQQFQHQNLGILGSSSNVRIIDAPRRPHSGIWFVFQASQHQAKEPFLPQLPKSYLRIKDGRMTVQVLMKYLVTKLRLNSESEIEITCKGKQLQPFLTLQHVRDNIWSSKMRLRRDVVVTSLPDSSVSDHVIILHYARSA